jgi:hypothetical protein
VCLAGTSHASLSAAPAEDESEKKTQVKAVEGLISRLLPHHSSMFKLHLGADCRKGDVACFSVEISPHHITITGSTGGALMSYPAAVQNLSWPLLYLTYRVKGLACCDCSCLNWALWVVSDTALCS